MVLSLRCAETAGLSVPSEKVWRMDFLALKNIVDDGERGAGDQVQVSREHWGAAAVILGADDVHHVEVGVGNFKPGRTVVCQSSSVQAMATRAGSRAVPRTRATLSPW